jgi:quaternary ammonium compound-resistance protein SugE
MIAWIYLMVAGILEIGWPVGLKVSGFPGYKLLGLVVAVLCLAGSGTCLWVAQKTIPMGTAYAVWTGIGAVGAFSVGVLVFGDAAGPLRVGSVALIVVGMVGLKVAHG